MNTIKALESFKSNCHEHYVSCYFSFLSLNNESNKFLESNINKDSHLWLEGMDSKNPALHAKIQISTFIENAGKNGKFTDQIIKSVLILLYAEWDEFYRHLIAKEIGVKAKTVKSDLIGDLRHIRNCIVHKKSVITDEHKKIKVLPWNLEEGKLSITGSMFSLLIEQINKMNVQIEKN